MATSSDSLLSSFVSSNNVLENDVNQRQKCYCKKKTFLISIGIMLSIYFLFIPLIATVVIGDEPLTLVHIKMLGLIPGTQTIRVSTQLKLSKSLPKNSELYNPTFSVKYNTHPLGKIKSDEALITALDGHTNPLNSSFEITSIPTLHNMGQDLMQLPNISWKMTAWSSVDVPIFNSPTLKFPIPYIYVSKLVSIKACDGLPDIHLQLFDLFDVPGPEKIVKLHIAVNFYNPSGISVVDFGHVKFNVFYQGSYITGLRTDGEFQFLKGQNVLAANGMFEPENIEVTSELISNFITGTECSIDAIAPATNASSIDLYSSFLAGMKLKARLKGYPQGVMVSGLLDFDPLKTIEDLILYGKVDVDISLRLYNPFRAVATVSQVNFTILYKGVEIAYSNSKTHVVIPGNSSQYTPKIIMTADTKGNKKNLDIIIECIETTIGKGHSLIGVNGQFTLSLGQYTFSPKYFQKENIIGCTFLDRKPCDDAKPPSGNPH